MTPFEMVPEDEAIGSRQWSMRVDDEGGLLRVFLRGRFGLDDWFAVLDAMLTTPGFHPGIDVIFDGREARFGFSSEETQRLVMKIRNRVESRGVAFVLPSFTSDASRHRSRIEF